jgi:hypothetical protein
MPGSVRYLTPITGKHVVSGRIQSRTMYTYDVSHRERGCVHRNLACKPTLSTYDVSYREEGCVYIIEHARGSGPMGWFTRVTLMLVRFPIRHAL